MIWKLFFMKSLCNKLQQQPFFPISHEIIEMKKKRERVNKVNLNFWKSKHMFVNYCIRCLFVCVYFFILRVKISHLQSKGPGHTNIISFNHILKLFFLQILREKTYISKPITPLRVFQIFFCVSYLLHPHTLTSRGLTSPLWRGCWQAACFLKQFWDSYHFWSAKPTSIKQIPWSHVSQYSENSCLTHRMLMKTNHGYLPCATSFKNLLNLHIISKYSVLRAHRLSEMVRIIMCLKRWKDYLWEAPLICQSKGRNHLTRTDLRGILYPQLLMPP